MSVQLPVIEQYEHHGKVVSVFAHLKGKHREHCLCFGCGKFKLDGPDNCRIAEAVFGNCVEFGIVSPVWECPEFVQK